MTDYVKSTNFASKDSLPTGNPSKIVKGTEIDTEFNNIATAVATKADINSPALTGTPTAPTAATGTNTTQIATTAHVKASLDALVVPTAQIADNAVTGAKIANNVVTPAKLSTGAPSWGTSGDVTVADLITTDATEPHVILAVNGSTRVAYLFATASNLGIYDQTNSKMLFSADTNANFKINSGFGTDATTYGCRAWVNFNGTGSAGSNQTIRANGNVATVYKTGTGRYRITFANSMPDANYAISMPSPSASGSAVAGVDTSYGSQTAAYVDVAVRTAGGTYVDSDNIHVAVFR